MHNFRELDVWKKARALTGSIYKLTASFPKHEQYGLVSQMQRAAVSIPSNIAEGAGRTTPNDFCHFLDMAKGSSFELETQIIIAYDLGYINKEQVKQLVLTIHEIQKMIFGLKKKLQIKPESE